MKITVTFLMLGFALLPRAHAANLVWSPGTADWDFAHSNWINTNTSAGATFANGDNVRFDDTGLGQANVAFGANLLTPNSVVVDSSAQYSFASTTGGKLTGAVALTKRGPGPLILDADNTLTGATSIEDGQVQIGSGASRGSIGSGPITNLSGLIINRTGTLTLSNYLTGAGGFTNRLNATVNLWGTNTMSGPVLVQIGMLSLSNSAARGNASEITLDSSTGSGANTRLGLSAGIDLPPGTTLNMVGTVASPLSRSTVQTVIAGDATTNAVNGPVRIGSGGGLIQFNGLSTGAGLLQINGNIANHPDNATPFAGSVYLRGAGNGMLTGSINLPEANCIRTDAGTFTVASTGNSWAGTLIAVGRLRLGANNALPNVAFSIGQGSGVNAILDLNGFDQTLPGLTSVHVANPNLPIIANSSTTSDSILSLSAGGVYSGLIQDSISNGTRRVGLTINNGAQQLGSVCTYSGPTTINGGGLSLTGGGSIPNTTPITLENGAAMDVRSKSDGTLTLQPAQTLKGNGTFKIEGSLASSGTIELKLDKTGGVTANDQVQITSDVATATITYGGTLKLVLSGEDLLPGDSFKIFDAAAYGGSFANLNPSRPGTGLKWDTSSLAIDGTLSVSAIATNPTNITSAIIGGGTQLHLSWPADHVGWMLQAQTNANHIGVSTNWAEVPASAVTNELYLPIDRTQGGVYYRLSY